MKFSKIQNKGCLPNESILLEHIQKRNTSNIFQIFRLYLISWSHKLILDRGKTLAIIFHKS